jgi:hypothetical protein
MTLQSLQKPICELLSYLDGMRMFFTLHHALREDYYGQQLGDNVRVREYRPTYRSTLMTK